MKQENFGKIYDQNLLSVEKADDDSVDWYEVSSDNFDIYGLVPEKDGVLTRRIPLDIAQKVSPGVLGQSGYGAGGRIVFLTDSPFVALRVEYGNGAVPTVCNHCFSYGFDLYKFSKEEKDVFVGAYRPVSDFDFRSAEFKVHTRNDGETICYTLNMPHFSEVKKLYIGLEKGSYLEKKRNTAIINLLCFMVRLLLMAQPQEDLVIRTKILFPRSIILTI